MDRLSPASRTARAVAVGRAVGIAGERDDAVLQLLPPSDRALVRGLRAVTGWRGVTGAVPAWLAHPALRMRAVDRAVEAVCRQDPAPAQVVIVGAGYDTRAQRLDALADPDVIEVDHPATQAAKLARLPPAAARAVTHAPADLTEEDLAGVLVEAGHDPDLPTLWLWEAVAMYLPIAAVERTLTVLAERSGDGSSLVMTTLLPGVVDPPALGRLVAGPGRAMMADVDEAIRWTATDAEAVALLARHGFTATEVSGVVDWADDAGLRAVRPALAERLHLAHRTRVSPPGVGTGT